MHLDGESALAFKVRSRNVELWTRNFSSLDGLLELEICVGFEASPRASRGHATGKVEAWRAIGRLPREPEPPGRTIRQRVEEMLVHPDEARDNGFSRQVEQFGIRRNPTETFLSVTVT